MKTIEHEAKWSFRRRELSHICRLYKAAINVRNTTKNYSSHRRKRKLPVPGRNSERWLLKTLCCEPRWPLTIRNKENNEWNLGSVCTIYFTENAPKIHT